MALAQVKMPGRMAGLGCMGSAAVLDAAIGRYRARGGDEQSSLRSVLGTPERVDPLLGDAVYTAYLLPCALRGQCVMH